MMRSKRILLAAIALCVITLWSIGTLAQQGTDCRRRIEPPRKGALDLTGEWMDNSVKLKVHIIQLGYNLNGFAEVVAVYLTPYKCAYPGSTTSGGRTAVTLDNDFSGQLTNSTIEGEVYICQSQTQPVIDTTIPHTEIYSEVVRGKLKDMTVSEDGNSIHGTFQDPAKGTQNISFTRLSKPDKSQYYPAGIIRTTATTKIYADSSTDSIVRFTVPPGTQLIFEDVKLDADGNPTWYRVVNGEGPVYSKNTGMIPATSITCDKPNPRVPGKTG